MSSSRGGPYRLERGGSIDRSRRLNFRFDGKAFSGYAGDSLASALLANGQRIVARSFKFHRPRGIFSCGIEEPNGLVQLGSGARTIPAMRAPAIELTDGLEAQANAGWPNLEFDFGRALDFVAPLWSAGFYNKTFIWPSWHSYEPFIRNMAGLGRAPEEPDPDRYEIQNLHCDVLVVGGGRAGLAAAIDLAGSGARVVLTEQDRQWGGEAAWNGAVIDHAPAASWIDRTVQRLTRNANVRLLLGTSAVGSYDHNVFTLLERVAPSSSSAPRERLWIVRAKRLVLATGAVEQPLLFANNDRPGIMQASAMRQYLHRYGIAPGSRTVIATNNDSAYSVAKELKDSGVNVVAVSDSRQSIPQTCRASLASSGIEILAGYIPIDTSGFSELRSVTLGRLTDQNARIDSKRTFACDALGVSGGFNPTLHLFAQSGGKLAYDSASGALLPVAAQPAIDIVGAAANVVSAGTRISPVGDAKRKWVDLLHDVTAADLELALRENYTSVEHVKRYTTVGMAPDQGKTSAPASLALLAELRDVPARALGHTTLRPPFVPVTLGAIAGRAVQQQFAPHKQLPMHDWHVANGGVFHDFGEWRRPVAYLRAGENRMQATKRECRSVRTAAGLFDTSPLGKIEIHGPDALEFLDRFYINDLTTLKPHRARYGFMLRESGIIFDDGTVVMLAPDRFLITTTSGNASRVAQWLEEWHQCEWPQLCVAIMPVTECWGTIALCGPQARTILAQLPTDIDLSPVAFPHLAMREGTLLDMPARIYRVSFTGELTYEINVPTDSAPKLWQALLDAGAPVGLQPLGLDGLLLLRLEKGFLHIGSDTDGTTVPADVGWGNVAAKKQRDYIGKRSLRLPEYTRPDRLQLVGLRGERGKELTIGSHLRLSGSTHTTDGWITSAGTTVMDGESVALALLRGGRGLTGSEVDVYDLGEQRGRARVVNPCFYDPAGDRMNA
jgi:sarcosine oxidase subunit alpha